MSKLGFKNEIKAIWTNGAYLRVKLRYTIYAIKSGWQRFWKGYDDSMWWNLDHSFCSLYIQLLKHLKNDSIGHPVNITSKEWEDILNKMIYHLKERDELFSSGDFVNSRYHKYEFFKLFAKHFDNLWD